MTTYRVLTKVASGGNATVFRAVAESALGVTRLVALKKPHPHLLDDPEIADAFRREAAISVRLRHPNVVQVFDVVEHEGSPSLVLELVDGMTLSELVRAQVRAGRGSESVAAAIRVVVDAARGLHALHEATDDDGAPLGLLHRDVSPQNVLLDRSGAVKLSDFGLVKAMLGKDTATTEGILKGKVGYLAPEYVSGAPLDRRSDVFALGVVAWEALAKKRLFRAERETEVLEKIRTMPIPSLREAAGEIGGTLDTVVGKALARPVTDRYATARDFADALEEAARRGGLTADTDAVARELMKARDDAGSAPSTGRSERPQAPEGARPAPPPPAPNDVPTVAELRAPRDAEGHLANDAHATTETWQLGTRDIEVLAPLPKSASPPAPAPSRPLASLVVAGLVVVASATAAAWLWLPTRSSLPDGIGSGAPGPEASLAASTPATSMPATSTTAASATPPEDAGAEPQGPAGATAKPTKPPPKPAPSAPPVASTGPRPNPYHR